MDIETMEIEYISPAIETVIMIHEGSVLIGSVGVEDWEDEEI